MKRAIILSLLLAGPAQAAAGSCPDPTPSPPKSAWSASEAWMHEPGWFVPLDDPKAVPAKGESYDADEPLMTVTIGSETRAWPVEALAYHHVANDVLGGTPIAVTY